MRIRILSGNSAGCVQEVPQIEGEVLLATGFGELVVEDAPSPTVAVVEAPTSSEPTPDPPPDDAGE